MEVAFRINLYRSQIDDYNAINANDGVKLGADGNENGVKMASNTVSEQIQKLLGIIESNPEATQAHT